MLTQFIDASSPLSSVSLDCSNDEDLSLLSPLDLSKVNIHFEVPLPKCGVKATMFSINDLWSYQMFNISIANVMSVAPKEIEVGYTLPWIKFLKKDLDSMISLFDDEAALLDLANQIEQHLLTEYSKRVVAVAVYRQLLMDLQSHSTI